MIKLKTENRLKSIKQYDIYKVFTYFFLCAFIGWIFETSVVYFETGYLTDRGLLFVEKEFSQYFSFLNNIPYIRHIPFIWGLPIIEIYGFGGVIIVLGIGKYKHRIWLLFIIGVTLLTILELIASYFCDYVLHQTFWNYSKDFMNFQGRICLRSSLAWGILSVLSIKIFKPKLESLYNKEILLIHYKTIVNVVMIYTFVCILFKIFVFK